MVFTKYTKTAFIVGDECRLVSFYSVDYRLFFEEDFLEDQGSVFFV